jgi:hypothetical protein
MRKVKQFGDKHFTGTNRAVHPTRSALEPLTRRIEAHGGLCRTPIIASHGLARVVVLKAGDTPHEITGNGFSGR